MSVPTENFFLLTLVRRAPPHNTLNMWIDCTVEEGLAIMESSLRFGGPFIGARLHWPAAKGGHEIADKGFA